MNRCPFEILGLGQDASLEEIDKQWRQMIRNVHPDKNNGGSDSHAKELNNARDRAKVMYETFDCHWARKQRDEKLVERKKKVLDIVRRIFEDESDKLRYYYNADIFKRAMSEYPEDMIKEAKGIVENGMGDSRKKLADSESNVVQLQEQIKIMEAQNNDYRSKQEIYESRLKAADLQILLFNEQAENSRLREKEKEKQLTKARAEIHERIRHFEEREELNKANAIKQIFLLQVELEKLKDDFNTFVSIEHQKETTYQADGPRCNAKKRKHNRFFSSEDNSTRFKNTVTEFITAHLVPSKNVGDFVYTKDITDMFNMKYPDGNYSNALFFKELKRQVSNFGFPSYVAYTQQNKLMGYKGLALH